MRERLMGVLRSLVVLAWVWVLVAAGLTLLTFDRVMEGQQGAPQQAALAGATLVQLIIPYLIARALGALVPAAPKGKTT